MMRTHNIALSKFWLLNLNIGREWGWCLEGSRKKIVQIAVFPMNFVTDCLKKSEKFQVWYFTVDYFESLWRHALTHYVTMVQVLTIFGVQISAYVSKYLGRFELYGENPKVR